MKKPILVFTLLTVLAVSCQNDNEAGIKIDSNNPEESISEAAIQFGDGEATNPEEYFNGLLGAVVEVDIKLREISRLDEIDASKEDITATLTSILEKIAIGRKGIALYTDKTWPKRAEFHDITVEWYDAIEALVNDHLFDLADPMSRPDETWTDEEFVRFENYKEAYDNYSEIDLRWVDMELAFAEENNLELGEKLDIDGIADDKVEDL